MMFLVDSVFFILSCRQSKPHFQSMDKKISKKMKSMDTNIFMDKWLNVYSFGHFDIEPQ